MVDTNIINTSFNQYYIRGVIDVTSIMSETKYIVKLYLNSESQDIIRDIMPFHHYTAYYIVDNNENSGIEAYFYTANDIQIKSIDRYTTPDDTTMENDRLGYDIIRAIYGM